MTDAHGRIMDELDGEISKLLKKLEDMKDDSWDFDPSVSFESGPIRDAIGTLNNESEIQSAYSDLYEAIDGMARAFESILDDLEEKYEDEDELEESEEVDYEPLDMAEECDR